MHNLRFFASAQEITDEQVWATARATGLSDELCGRPNIQLEPSGVGLSASDRFAIGLTRAVLSQPDALLVQGSRDRAICDTPHECPWLTFLTKWRASAPEGGMSAARTVVVDVGGRAPVGATVLHLEHDEKQRGGDVVEEENPGGDEVMVLTTEKLS